MCGEDACRLTNVPLHRMQPVAAVGDVRSAEILGAREEVSQPHRDQRAHANLERTRAARDADIVRPGVVDVDRIETHPDRILEVGRARAALVIGRYLLLEYGLASPEPPALAYVRVLAQGINCREDVGTGPELGKPRRPAGSRRLRLQPVEEAEAHPLGVLERLRLLARRPVEDTPVAVVVAGPVEHAEIARVAGGGREKARVDEPAVGPEPALGVGCPLQHLVFEPPRLLAVDLAAVDVDA